MPICVWGHTDSTIYRKRILKFPTTHFKFKPKTKKGLQYHVKLKHIDVYKYTWIFFKIRKVNTKVVK